MFKLRLLSLLTAGCLLLSPLSAAAAADSQTITLTPPEKMPAAAGKLTLQFDRNMNGTTFQVFRVQQEGEFLYYSHRITLCDGVTVDCPLWEGDYKLVLLSVLDDSAEYQQRDFAFTIDDPDNDLSFDQSQRIFVFDTDPEAASDTSTATNYIDEQRSYVEKYLWDLAQPEFRLGDLDGNDTANSADAAVILMAAAEVGAGGKTGFTSLQTEEADINGDQFINSVDAADLLQYAAASAAGNFSGDLLEYIAGH